MSLALRRLLLGRPLPTAHAVHTRLPKRLALAVFSSDALSSTAYATEEILRVLMLYSVAGSTVPALGFSWPIALAIALLLVIVSLSYRQTIYAYPGGASAYLVAKDNLGTLPSLVAGASLLMDYILTVAVSISAGVAAIVSAVPALHPYVVTLCLFFIGFITLLNLRGAKESGVAFAIPTYTFVFSIFLMIVLGLYHVITGNIPPAPPGSYTGQEAQMLAHSEARTESLAPLTLLVILRAFTAGCTALTGIEAISDGIPAFRRPESINAAKTLLIMVTILVAMFLGISFVANQFHLQAIPEEVQGYETIISQIGHRVFAGRLSLYYYILMGASAAILVVAANTAYADFPRLASLLARDSFLPRQLANLGDRLVFQNGILALAALSALLVLLFGGSVTALLPLYAVGVFTSFTLSQTSMVRKWLRERGPGWQASMAMNLIGASATGIVLVVIAITKFNAGQDTGVHFGDVEIHYGAWMIIALVPLLVVMFQRIKAHYGDVARHLVPALVPSLQRERNASRLHHTVLVLVPGIHKGVFPALEYARSLSEDARAVFIEVDPEGTPALKEDWERYVSGVPLIILESPYRSLVGPLVEYVEEVKDEREDDVVTIVLPELVSATRWWHRFLHNLAGKTIRQELGKHQDLVVTSFRYFSEGEGPKGELMTLAAENTDGAQR